MSQMEFQIDDETPVYVISVAAQLSGLHPQTLRQYDRLVTLLETELDARPARDTTEVRDRIARGELAMPAP